MSIDRIGKGGALPPTPETQGTGSAAPTGAPGAFKVDRADPATQASGAERAERTGAVAATDAASPLARLRAGELDVRGYIDLKVDEATSALQGMSSAELDEIKSVLRDQLSTDPGLADLVRTATGKMPTPPED